MQNVCYTQEIPNDFLSEFLDKIYGSRSCVKSNLKIQAFGSFYFKMHFLVYSWKNNGRASDFSK